jgi:diguanylate cyclase (GGDEF)-like protein
MTILIVDDNETIIYLLKKILLKAGYNQILTAGSSREAANLLQLDSNDADPVDIDLILLDVMMPDTDGIQICSMIKNHERYSDVPIIIVTGITAEDTLKHAFEAGAIDYITKPFNAVELLVRVRSALKLKHEIDQRKLRESQLLHVTQLLEEAVSKLTLDNMTDGLTGVKNRRGFDEQLSKEYQRKLRENYNHNKAAPISLILLDVDQFKCFNDHYGHLAGDHCLQHIARVLDQQLKRPGDYVARYGGEEFVVLLPDTSLEEATIIAERLRIAVENLKIPHSFSKVSSVVTVSLGVYSFLPTLETSTDLLIDSTDKALYEAKAAGRNRVHVYSEIEHKFNLSKEG